ncbi:ornithine cyclodeaminase family protein [Sporolactobacillus sp. THM7-7]|nr:ornithine cyclodeaminase family protein [Sporolactobacillus sp. THM7-7]
MLALSKEDMLHVITMKDAMHAVEEAYKMYEADNFFMPRRAQITKDNKNTLLFMPCFSSRRFGSKIVTVFPENAKKGASATQGLMLLNDAETGGPLAIMDGTFLTAFRTGAIGGVAIRHLSGRDTIRLGLIGTGVQGKYLLLAACTAGRVSDIYLYNRTPSKISAFIKEVRPWLKNHPVAFHIAEQAEDAVRASDVIITATTSYQPVLPDQASILSNKLFIGIGSYQPDMREFPKALYPLLDKVYIDTMDAAAESGDIIDPLEKQWIARETVIPFSKVIAGKKHLSDLSNKTILFKSVGMSLFDLCVADTVFEKAKALGVGKKVN